MTEFSNASHGGRSFARFARHFILISVCLFAMASWCPSPVEGRHRLGRMARLYHYLSARVSRLERIVYVLSREECQTGVVDFSICPGFKETSTQVILDCVMSPSNGGGANITDMTVIFAEPFRRPPIVDATYSGLALLAAKNSSMEIIDVQRDHFTIRQIADDFLPVATQASFFACPSALV